MAQRADRLKRREDFLRLAGGRRKAVTPGMVMQVANTPEGPSSPNVVRLGFTASRKVGGAVARNRAKRRLRALARSAVPKLPGGLDIVLIARRTTVDRPYQTLKQDLAASLTKLGLAEGRGR
ncbi:MAG: ribonuclease P protein component [Pseudomonadota bacterium]